MAGGEQDGDYRVGVLVAIKISDSETLRVWIGCCCTLLEALSERPCFNTVRTGPDEKERGFCKHYRESTDAGAVPSIFVRIKRSELVLCRTVSLKKGGFVGVKNRSGRRGSGRL